MSTRRPHKGRALTFVFPNTPTMATTAYLVSCNKDFTQNSHLRDGQKLVCILSSENDIFCAISASRRYHRRRRLPVD